MNLHVGNLVRKVMDDKRMKYNTLIPFLSTNKTNITVMLNKADWRISELVAASKCVQQNLFWNFIDSTDNTPGNIVMESAPVYGLQVKENELQQLRKELESKNELIVSLREQLQLQKEKIRDLEIKLNNKE